MLLDITEQLAVEHAADIKRAETMEPFDQEFLDWVRANKVEMVNHGFYDDLNLGNTLNDIFSREYVDSYAENLPYNKDVKTTQIQSKGCYLHYTNFITAYGVVDNVDQLKDLIKPLIECPDRNFVVSVCRIDRADQSDEGGWRWHKWGPYYGNHEPQCEYLYDEVGIDSVVVYHIYEILSEHEVLKRQKALIAKHLSGLHRDFRLADMKRGNTVYYVLGDKIRRFQLHHIESLNEYWFALGDARGNVIYLVVGYGQIVNEVFPTRRAAKAFVRARKMPHKGFHPTKK